MSELRKSWTDVRQAWEAIAVPMPDRPAPTPDEEYFSTPEARRAYYRSPAFGDRYNPNRLFMQQPEFRRVLLDKSELRPGSRVLLLGEFFRHEGVFDFINDAVQPGGDIEYIEMIPHVEAHDVGRWPVYTEICEKFTDGQFDSIIASQWHHCLDPRTELAALSRVVRPGGKIALFEPGPTAATFALAEQDAWLESLLRFFVTAGGAREVPVEHAYAWKRASWLTVGVDDIREAAERCLDDVSAWQHRGMAIVDGRRPGSAGTASDLETDER